MKTQKILRTISRVVAAGLFSYAYFSAEPVFAGITAEYKCTVDCSLCISFDKKTVCSEKYQDDSDEYQKGKKLSRFVNEGLIIPTSDIKQGFSLNAFANKFFNCEFMIKKAEQIRQAADNMCVRKTVKREVFERRGNGTIDDNRDSRVSERKPTARERGSDGRLDSGRASETSREPASTRDSSSSRSNVREKEDAGPSLREIRKRRKREAEGDGKELAPPPANDNMDDLIKQMDN